MQTLDAERMCNVIYAFIIRDVGPFADVEAVRRELDDQLLATVTEQDIVQGQPTRRAEPDPETWGTTPEDIAAQEAFMNMRL